MNPKQIDPKGFTRLVTFALAVGAVVALVGWAWVGLQQAQTFSDPVQNEIQKDHLL